MTVRTVTTITCNGCDQAIDPESIILHVMDPRTAGSDALDLHDDDQCIEKWLKNRPAVIAGIDAARVAAAEVAQEAP